MRLRLLLITACLAGVLIGASPASAIVDGKADEAEHPYVGFVFIMPPFLPCTGALVAPDRVLTAASCFVFRAPNQVIVFTLANPAPNPLTSPGAYVHGRPTIHPGFDQNAISITDDLAVIELDVPYPGATEFARLPKLGVVDDMLAKNHKGHLVGYGLSGPVVAIDGPVRNVKHIRFVENSTPNHVRLERASACGGDRGGPVLRGTHVLALVSVPRCTGESTGYRLDTPAAQEFLASHSVPLHPAAD